MKPHSLFIEAAAIATLPFVLFTGCSKPQKQKSNANEPASVSVSVQNVEARPHVAAEDVTGTVRSRIHASIEAKVTGRIEKMLVAPGQRVKQGEALVQIEAREIQAKYDHARALLEQSEKDLIRYTQLLSNKVTTQAEFDRIQSSNRVAKAALAEAETNMGYLTITAPFDGVITRKPTDVGDLASPGKTLLEMEDLTLFRFEADVPEAIIEAVLPNASLPIRLGNTELTGTVSEIAPAADAQSRTFLVKLDLPPSPGLRTGQFGRVAVPVSQSSILRIPAAAVVQRGQMELVFVVNRDRAQLRLVKTGKHFGNEVEIVSGLTGGEPVATENVARLVDGQRVEVQAK